MLILNESNETFSKNSEVRPNKGNYIRNVNSKIITQRDEKGHYSSAIRIPGEETQYVNYIGDRASLIKAGFTVVDVFVEVENNAI